MGFDNMLTRNINGVDFPLTPEDEIELLAEWAANAPSEPAPPTLEDIQAQRLVAYKSESDPLKIEADYEAYTNGHAPDYDAWVAKVEEIKERYPIP